MSASVEKITVQAFAARHLPHGGDLTVAVDATGDALGTWVCRCPCGDAWVGDTPGLLNELGEVRRA